MKGKLTPVYLRTQSQSAADGLLHSEQSRVEVAPFCCRLIGWRFIDQAMEVPSGDLEGERV